MSGPIIRKYGFPNFEGIFGERKPVHGSSDAPPDQAPNPIAPRNSDQPETDPSTQPASPAQPPPGLNPDDPTGRATEAPVNPATSFGNALE